MLGMLSFAAPLWAWGLVAAAAIPVAAHLLSRTRYREVWFPATRLLREAVVTTSRIERPRHLLLMLLRIIALALIAVAFTRPQWVPADQAIDPEQGLSLVLLIDASASMQRVDNGITLFDRAVREAQRLLDSLDPTRDVATIIEVGALPRSLLPEPSAAFQTLSQRLEASQATYGVANWAGAYAAADRLVADDKRAVRVVTLSDQQGQSPNGKAYSQAGRNSRTDHVRLVGPADNTSVRLVDVTPYPAIAGRTLQASVRVEHFGQTPRTVTLSASFNGSTSAQRATLDPGQSQTIAFELQEKGREGGLLRVTIDGRDAIGGDDATGAFVPVQTNPQALVIYDDAAGTEMAERIGRLLRPGDVRGIALPQLTYVPADEASDVLERADPALVRSTILVIGRPMSDALNQSLRGYLERGGGCVEVRVSERETSSGVQAAGIDFSLEPLRIFEGSARASLASLSWPEPLSLALPPGALAVLETEAGDALITADTAQRGRWMRLHSPLSRGAGGLLAEPVFVVLFAELMRYASPGPEVPAPPMIGDAIPSAFRLAFDLKRPDGSDPSLSRYDAPGAYIAMNPSQQVIGGAVAAIDPSESDTQSTEPWTTESAASAARQTGAIASPTLRKEPLELWPYLLLAAGLALAIESTMLGRFAGAAKAGDR